MPQEKSQQDKSGKTAQAGSGQKTAGNKQNGVPLSQSQQAAAGKLEGEIKKAEQQLQGASNTQLEAVAAKLETVERALLLDKIDNELHTIKDTMIKPGDRASTVAGVATDASVVDQTSSE